MYNKLCNSEVIKPRSINKDKLNEFNMELIRLDNIDNMWNSPVKNKSRRKSCINFQNVKVDEDKEVSERKDLKRNTIGND